MKKIFLIIVLLLQAIPACAQVLSSTTGGKVLSPIVSVQNSNVFDFRDSYGWNFATNFGWQDAQVVASNRLVAMGTTPPSRYPNSTIQITVQPGDNPIPGCPGCHERNEVLNMFTPVGHDETVGGTAFYAESIWIPSDFQNDGGISTGGFFWNISNQMHGPDTGAGACNGLSPSFAICFSCGEPPSGTAMGVPNTHLILDVRGGECASATRAVIDLGTRVTAQWIDLVFQIHWAIDNTGYVNVWTRTNETGTLQQVQLDGLTPIPQTNTPTMYALSGVAVTTNYWKHGMYRDGGAGYNTVYYSSPFVRAQTMAAAAIQSFGGQYP